MTQKLKVRMQGAKLRAFTRGDLSDADVRAQGYDPDTVRTYHCIPVRSDTEYVAAWRELIAITSDPLTLLDRWRTERDKRDRLKVPVTQRLDILRQIAPEEGEAVL